MRILIEHADGTRELIPITFAKTQISGVASFNLPKWYERYTKEEQVEVLDYIGDIDGDTPNVISVALEHPIYKFCNLFYKDEHTCASLFDKLINSKLISTSSAAMWIIERKSSDIYMAHFDKNNI